MPVRSANSEFTPWMSLMTSIVAGYLIQRSSTSRGSDVLPYSRANSRPLVKLVYRVRSDVSLKVEINFPANSVFLRLSKYGEMSSIVSWKIECEYSTKISSVIKYSS